MILHLKNNHIYLPASNNTITENKVHFFVSVLDLDVTKYNFVAIVNGKSINFENAFMINRDELNTPYIELSIHAIEKATGRVIKYTADKYPVTRAVVLGRPSSDWYPAVMQNIIERLTNLEKEVKQHSSSITELTTDINLLGCAVKEINEIGEIV